MNGRELSDFNTGEHPSNSSNPNTFLGSYEVDLADKLNQFRLALENDRVADTMSHCFTFQSESLDDVYLPDQVRQLEKRHGQLQSVIVECSYLKESSGSSFELRMEFCDQNENSTWLTVVRPYSTPRDMCHHDTVSLIAKNQTMVGGRSYQIDAFTPQEFNRCLGSIVYNSPHISQSVFDSFDWHQDDYTIMTDNFSHVANSSWSGHEYLLSDSDGGYAGSLQYFKASGDVSEMRLSRIDHQHASVNGNDLHYEEKTVELSLPLASGSSIELFEHSSLDGSTSTQICLPVESDYRTAMEFINDQLNCIQSVSLESFNDETTQPFDD